MGHRDRLTALEQLDLVRHALERLERYQRNSLDRCKDYMAARARILTEIIDSPEEDPYHVLSQEWIDDFTAKMGEDGA